MKLITLSTAKALLEKGDVVAIPTETVYGLAGHIFSEEGLKKIFATKERPFFDPLIVHIDTVEKARALTSEWTQVHEVLAQNLWPGPLTLIAKKNDKVNSLITSGLDSVGLRCPRHPETLKLLSQIEGGLAAPSANKFGKTSPTTSQHVSEEFGDEVCILEGGPAEIGIESTVVGILEKNGEYQLEIFRPGFFTASMLQELLDQHKVKASVGYAESPVAPGQLKHHYMPNVPLVIVNGELNWEREQAMIQTCLKCSFQKPALWYLPSDAHLASRELYQKMREFDHKGHDIILVQRLPLHSREEWKGIWNRLEKAQTLTL